MEVFAILFTLLSVWLVRKKNIWCWLTGLIGAVFYFLIFYKDQSIANAVLQVIAFGQGIYGWVTWGKEDEDNVTLGGFSLVIVELFFIFIIGFTTYLICESFGGKTLVLDSITAAISIVAMVLTAHKKIESWIYWGIADIFYITFFLSTGHPWSALLYGIFLINAIFGYTEWKKSIKAPIL